MEFFDFVVSTSFYQSVAEKFAKDKKGGVGYVLIMNDVKHRNCSKKLKKMADCFINHEEYLEEFEVPYVGYVLPEELDGFIVDDLKVSRSKKKNSIILEQRGSFTTVSLTINVHLKIISVGTRRPNKNY